jgi:hypothetical protein
MPLIARRQWMYIPIPIPKAAKKPALLPYRFTCLIMIAVSGPGLVRAIRCAIDDHINIIK